MKIPRKPPAMSKVVSEEQLRRLSTLLSQGVARAEREHYLHWDKMRRKQPLPDGIETHEEWWMVTKFRRSAIYKELPFKSVSGEPFVYCLPDVVHEQLHKVDQKASGRVPVFIKIIGRRSHNL